MQGSRLKCPYTGNVQTEIAEKDPCRVCVSQRVDGQVRDERDGLLGLFGFMFISSSHIVVPELIWFPILVPLFMSEDLLLYLLGGLSL